MHLYRETTLTGASLRNGRIYFSASDAPFFAVERLGDHPGKEPGTPVQIQVHGETVTTDIRQASGASNSNTSADRPAIQGGNP